MLIRILSNTGEVFSKDFCPSKALDVLDEYLKISDDNYWWFHPFLMFLQSEDQEISIKTPDSTIIFTRGYGDQDRSYQPN